ncbi:MAG: ribonuclease III family protein, partial [Bacteroidota bacterium]
QLAKMRALIVSEPTLARCAAALNLGRYLRLGRGEAMTGGRERPSNLADAFEAVVGAFYHAGGLEAAKGFILAQLGEELDRTEIGRPWDAKTRLQELLQAGGVKPTYVVTGEEGPDHDKWFTVVCLAGSRNLGVGRGRSKKEAEQAAARQALAVLEGGGGREAPR